VKEMVDILGEPSEDFLRRSEHSSRLFDENGKYSADYSLDGAVDQIADYRFVFSGKWIAEPPITALPLVNRAKHIRGNSKAEILDFLKAMLCWLPEERKSARELLGHPWLSGCEDWECVGFTGTWADDDLAIPYTTPGAADGLPRDSIDGEDGA
jgi:serine/threonine protein kinase